MSLSKHIPELMYPIGNPKMKPIVICYEYVDVKMLESLIKHPGINHEDRLKLKAFRRLPRKGDRFKVEYVYSQYSHNNSGRLFALRSVGLQSFMCEIRNLLAGEYYYDIDQCNSLPTILQYLFKKYDILCPQLDEYVANRDEVLKKENLTKKKFLKALLKSKKIPKSAFLKSIHAVIYHQLLPALKKDAYWENVAKHHKTIQKQTVKNNPDGSFISKVCHTYENRILLCMKKFFTERGLSVDVLIFDGCMVRKDPVVTVDDALLRECEAVILENVKIPMKLAIKPMIVPENWLEDLESNVEDGEVVETEDEDDGVKITPIPLDEKLSIEKAQDILDKQKYRGLIRYLNNFFAKVTDEMSVWFAFRASRADPWIIRSKANTREAVLHWKVKSEESAVRDCIFDIWSSNKDMLTFKKIVMNPKIKGDTPWEELNLFKGLKAQRLGTFDKGVIEPVRHHLLNVICSGKPEHALYLEKWLASIVQFPWQKTGVAPVIFGDQGAGKNILFEWWGKSVIGPYHYLYLNDLNDLTGQFTSYSAAKIFTLGDEVSFSGGFKTNSIIKSKITQANQKLEKKGVDPITIDDFSNYVFLSNHDNAMKIEDSDRRFFVKETSNIYVGNRQYFDNLAKSLNQNTADHFYTYLMQLDLTEFNVRNMPDTDEKVSMKVWAMSPFDHFVEEFIKGGIVYTHGKNAYSENGDWVETPTKFFEPDKIHETTIDYLYDRFMHFVKSHQAGTDRTDLSKIGFSRMIRKKVDIQDKNKGYTKGVEVFVRVARL